MRSFACACLLATMMLGQEKQTSTYVYDLGGKRVDWSQSKTGDGRKSETVKAVNGRQATAEEVEEKVLKNEGGVRVIERLTKRFDQDGRPLPAERTVTETVTLPDGGSTEKITMWRGDLNGRMQASERVTSETRKSGAVLATVTRVERPDLSGGFSLAERREARAVASESLLETDEFVFRPDANGRFARVGRKVVKQTKLDGQTEETADEYEAATTGSLQLARHTSSRSVKRPDGSEQRDVEVYGPAAPGRPVADVSKPQLRERQFHSTKVNPDGSTVETFSIQRPSLTSSKELGPIVRISETVCTGKCR